MTAHPTPDQPCGRLLYAASETSADMAYASGFMAPDPFLWYETPDERGVLVSVLEVGRACRETVSGTTVRSMDAARSAWALPASRSRVEHLIGALARQTGIRRWLVPEDFPLGLARKLGRMGLRLETVAPFCPARECKQPEEIERIREGVRLAETGLERALEVLRASAIDGDGMLRWNGEVLTAETLRGEVDACIARHGGSASRTITAPGRCGADCHDMGSGPIAAHVPIVLDIFPRVNRTGYFGDLTRTVVRGQAPEVVRRAFAAVLAAQEAAFAKLVPGVPAREVHAAAATTLEAAGFATDSTAVPPLGFFHGLGHGLGLEVHEGPRVNGRADQPLRPGHVVTIEPGLYYPEWGGVRLEDVVAVTETGYDNLTRVPKILEI